MITFQQLIDNMAFEIHESYHSYTITPNWFIAFTGKSWNPSTLTTCEVYTTVLGDTIEINHGTWINGRRVYYKLKINNR